MTATIYVPGTEETDPKKIIMSLQQTAAYLTKAQFAFPATQVDSTDANTLDDYEEGTWTPVLTFATPGNLSVAYTLQNAYYTKIGRLVSIQFAIVTSTFTHTTASGNMTMTGLPFTAVNDAGYRAYSPLLFQGISKASYSTVQAVLFGNTSQLLIGLCGMGQPVVVAAPADAPSAGTVILGGTMSYVV